MAFPVANIALMPIYGVWVDLGDGVAGDGQLVHFTWLEQDSTWSLNPITQATDTGGQRVVAWRLNLTAVVIYNNFHEMPLTLDKLARNPVDEYVIELSSVVGQAGGKGMIIQMADSSIGLADYSCLINIASAEMRPRLTLTLSGLFSADFFAHTDGGSPFTASAPFADPS